MAFEQQRPEGQRLGRRPVDAFPGIDHLALGFELTDDFPIEIEVIGNAGQRLADLFQALHGNAGFAAPGVAGRHRQPLPGAVQPVRLVGLVAGRRLEGLVQFLFDICFRLFQVLLGKDAFGDQLVGVDFASRRVFGDLLVHGRLGEHRLVAFVVTVAAVADHVDDHVLLELLAIFGGHAGAMDDRLRVVGVDVENGRGDDLGDVGAIGRRARIFGRRGEADLVVDDDVNGAAGLIADQVRQIEGLRH